MITVKDIENNFGFERITEENVSYVLKNKKEISNVFFHHLYKDVFTKKYPLNCCVTNYLICESICKEKFNNTCPIIDYRKISVDVINKILKSLFVGEQIEFDF